MMLAGKCEIKGQGRRFAALVLSIGLVQVAAYYFAAATVNGSGPLAIVQPDTLLYCQAARRIVEGHPFSFSAGSAVCTGTTSVLYPFVLAVPYALGCTGEALFSAGFVLNALFYLAFLLGWSLAFRRWASMRTASFAALLLALFPQPAYCAMAQSDTGLWLAVSGLFAAGLSANAVWLYAPLLLLGPWVRPEGMVMVLAFAVFSVVSRRRRDMGLAVAGVVSCLGVALLNKFLTGASGFSSVAGKGYFSSGPFSFAVTRTFLDFMMILRDLVLGLGAGGDVRYIFGIPCLGAIALAVGVFTRIWKRPRDYAIGILALAAFGGVGTVAMSGWQGTNFDRYLAWIVPLLVFFGASGWLWCARAARRFPAARVLPLLPLLYALGSDVYAVCNFNVNSELADRYVKFGREVERALWPSASVGAASLCGLAYVMGDRHVAHLSGIYSPEFACEEHVGKLEVLKYEPETRFDCWCYDPKDSMAEIMAPLLGRSLIVGPYGLDVKLVDWAPFDAAARAPVVPGKRLVDRVDVGYEKDERKADYDITYRYAMRPFDPIVKFGKIKGAQAVDAGRVVVGFDEMTVSNLEPGKDLFVVLRTTRNAPATRSDADGMRYSAEYAFDDELDLHIDVDGEGAACCHAHIGEGGFGEAVLQVPGKAIASPSVRIRFIGDHVTFGYWFYQ